ncbi:MAG: beta-lactamase family protein [Lachnospiraceae bacterium]|nr:beta-lactamase family protein [Lachnospiraceae bacterium]
MKKQSVIAVLTFLITVLFFGIRTVYASDSDDIENLIRRYRKETKCENVSVAIYDNGDITYYGDSESLYQIGSMTKSFTGLAIQKLIDEGLVKEDGNVSNYISGFEAYYKSESADITVRNLLEQKSGFTNSEKDYPSATADMTLSEWAESISGLELNSQPGSEYCYSNVNYNLLGLIIENVSGMSYAEYMEQEILIPLGLNNTYASFLEDARIVEGTRLGYRHAFEFSIPVREASIPAGYFYSNINDMGRWIEIWTGDIGVPDNLKRPLAEVKTYFKEEGDYYSGWELFGDDVIGHSGGTPNYSSRIVFSEDQQTGVCVLSNLNVAATTDSLCNNIFDIVSGKNSSALNTDIWTIFDRVFTCVTIAGIIVLIIILKSQNRILLTATGIVILILLSLILILFPIIFGAGMKEIMFTWAPWSLAISLLIIAADIAVTAMKLLMVKIHADHNKTSKGQTADRNN